LGVAWLIVMGIELATNAKHATDQP
jgi:hypothetical protein